MLLLFFFCLFLSQINCDIARKVVLDQSLHSGAACLDGSAPVYYFAPGIGAGAKKWYIHFQGGGWCFNLDLCLSRSKGNLGSSKNTTETMDFASQSGYFSTDPKVNPLMHNWNRVYLHYCDGASFSGNNDTVTVHKGEKLYFRGFKNLMAYKKDLDTNRQFQQATDIVISGCSAGGLATFMHVDWWKQQSPRAKVVGLPDSGFFLDFPNPKINYDKNMRWVFRTQNSTSNQKCLSANPSTPEKCIFAEHISPYIDSPIFPMQPEFDSWQIQYILGVDNSQVSLINSYGKHLRFKFRETILTGSRHNGAFLDSCTHHCGKWNKILINDTLISNAFAQFYANPLRPNHNYIQNKNFPCNNCCQ